MSVNPGFGDQLFNFQPLRKIEAARTRMRVDARARVRALKTMAAHPQTASLRSARARIVSSAGTAVFHGGSDSYAANIAALRGSGVAREAAKAAAWSDACADSPGFCGARPLRRGAATPIQRIAWRRKLALSPPSEEQGCRPHPPSSFDALPRRLERRRLLLKGRFRFAGGKWGTPKKGSI